MQKNKKSLLTAITPVIFILIEALLFYLIHIARADLGISLRYLSIQITALFSWIFIASNLRKAAKDGASPREIIHPSSGILIGLSMLCTLAADYFLVAIPEMKRMEGMICFLGTQLFIFLHIFAGDKSKKRRSAHIAVRLISMAILVGATLLVLRESADALALVSVVYYANLLTSMIFAPGHPRRGRLLCLGLILFALCDINVGLAVLNDLYGGAFAEGSLLYRLIYSGVDLAWIFYLPSQALIPLSILQKEQ